MDNKKIKIAIAVTVAVIVVASIWIVLAGSNRNKKSNQQETVVPIKASSRKEVKEYDIQTVIGKVVSIDENAENIQINLKDGRKLSLIINAGAVDVIKQGKQKDGSFVNESIGLFNVPKDEDVEIQYNAKTNELLMIVVK
ncbi:MAG: hypothetical protein WC678_03450 [Parcubacteria group bacterium]|jgi:hypothetical protein